MNSPTNSSPRLTTLVGGSLLALTGLLEILPIVLSQIPATNDAYVVAQSASAQAVRAIALFVACLILAFGIRGETGIVGASISGRAGFLALAFAFPLQGFASFALGGGVITTPAVVLGTLLGLLPLAVVVVAAVGVARARILSGFARWSLVIYAVAQAIVFALSSVPNASQGYYIVVLFYLAAVPPLALLAAGLSFVLAGRTDAVKLRFRTAYDTWRLTTSVG